VCVTNKYLRAASILTKSSSSYSLKDLLKWDHHAVPHKPGSFFSYSQYLRPNLSPNHPPKQSGRSQAGVTNPDNFVLQILTPQLFAMRWEQQLSLALSLPGMYRTFQCQGTICCIWVFIRFLILGQGGNNRVLSPAQWVS